VSQLDQVPVQHSNKWKTSIIIVEKEQLDPNINKVILGTILIHPPVTSVADPCNFGTDPDPRIHTSDLWIRIRMQILILLFSSVTFSRLHNKKMFLSFFAYDFLKVQLHHFQRYKSNKEVTEQ
jgi:hypothetical protein